MTLMLEQQVIDSDPAVEGDPVEQRCVPLGMRDYVIGGGEHNFSEAPNPGSSGSGGATPPLGEPLHELGGRDGGWSVVDFK
jgi:hypothetical protein